MVSVAKHGYSGQRPRQALLVACISRTQNVDEGKEERWPDFTSANYRDSLAAFLLLVLRHAGLVTTARLSKLTLSLRLDLLTKRSMKVPLRAICVSLQQCRGSYCFCLHLTHKKAITTKRTIKQTEKRFSAWFRNLCPDE